MNDRSPQNAATRHAATEHDDILHILERCVKGKLAKSYFDRKYYKQTAVEKRPDHTLEVSGIRDDQHSQSGTSEELLQNSNENDILSFSANNDMGKYKEREERTPATQQFKIGSKTERQ